MSCSLELFEDLCPFSSAVVGFLEEREAENALFLGVIAGPGESKAFMARAVIGGKIRFAAFYREINLIVSRGPDEAVEAAAARIRALGIEIPGVVGPAGEAERFALAWARERGCGHFLAVDQRIYELTEVRRSAPIPGRMCPVRSEDLEVVAEWAHEFDREALPHEPHTPEEARLRMARRIQEGNLFAWTVGGRLVSMAGLARPTSHTISVNSVYTPPSERCRGFATALVAAVSQEGLGRGKRACVLYTDLSNPTSNSIYPKIGYRPVCDSRNYRFRPA